MYDFIVQRTNSFTVEGTAVAWRQYALRSFDVFGDSYLTGDQVRRVYCLGVSFCSSAAHQIVPGLKETSQRSKVATVEWLQGFDISSLLFTAQTGGRRADRRQESQGRRATSCRRQGCHHDRARGLRCQGCKNRGRWSQAGGLRARCVCCNGSILFDALSSRRSLSTAISLLGTCPECAHDGAVLRQQRRGAHRHADAQGRKGQICRRCRNGSCRAL